LEYEKYSHIIRTLGFDYLTSVDYNDGLSNEVQSWDYDAAGNRISASANPGTWTYDNLNRMSASPGVIYTHDMVGNRTAKSVGAVETRYEWDAVNRMTKLGYPNSDYEYVYRSDGMRVRKIKNGGDEVTRSYYDGQMPVEEDVTTGGSTTLTRNFVGARGLEAISTTQNSVTNVSYPLYDTHGNMVATLTKNTGGTAWSIGDERSYDVWGSVRSGAATGGPKGRYVASLGHVQDDESGLIYMRARYYEPESGRFVSEDPAMDGGNWFNYANQNPTNFFDRTGCAPEQSIIQLIGMGCMTIGTMMIVFASREAAAAMNAAEIAAVSTYASKGVAYLAFGLTFMGATASDSGSMFTKLFTATLGVIAKKMIEFYAKGITSTILSTSAGGKTVANVATVALCAYSLQCFAHLLSMDFDTLQ
jgi:RHS repeat-associated protein